MPMSQPKSCVQVYWINPMAWAQQSLAINEFKCVPCDHTYPGPYDF